MSTSDQERADAAIDSYANRSQADVNRPASVIMNGQEYRVFGYKDDPSSGFHATAYQSMATGDIIIAYRGTDPDLKHHTRTTAQDAAVDFMMVKDGVNLQEGAARAFTREMLEKAQALGIPKDQITLAGHSLGGTLAEIEASKFGLRGVTFNAYGAVDLGYGVPEGGTQVTNYVMAGDVVSAASRHYGQTIALATEDDIASLRAGRYLDAPPRAPAPNPLLAMRLGDHGGGHFTGPDSVLKPENLAQARQNYAEHKAAFDHLRSDIHADRAELAVALSNPDSRNLATTWANLPPQMQQQLAEYHAHLVDRSVQSAVEHNRAVQGVEWGLHESAAALQGGGEYAQQAAEQTAQRLHAAGQTMQRQTDDVARGATAFMPVAPLAATGLALGAEVAGHVGRIEADGYAMASRLTGQAVHAGSQFVAGQYELTRHTVETGVHLTAEVATEVAHTQESAFVKGFDLALDTSRRASQAYDAARQTVSRGIHAAEQAAGQAYDTLRNPEQWFHHDAPSIPVSNARSHAAASADPGDARNDPRHPANPHHELYQHLKARVPDASEKRLLQFTGACHAQGIGENNLGEIVFDRQRGQMTFHPLSAGPLATVDLRHPSPEPAQSIQELQQIDQMHVQMQTLMHAQTSRQQAPLQ